MTVTVLLQLACGLLAQSLVLVLLSTEPCSYAQDDGYIAQLLVGDGASNIDVNTPLAVIVEEQVSRSIHPSRALLSVVVVHPTAACVQLIEVWPPAFFPNKRPAGLF